MRRYGSERGRSGYAGSSFSSNSAVSAAFTDTLVYVTKHSCRAFANLGLTPDAGT
jgi:hypothetical protein